MKLRNPKLLEHKAYIDGSFVDASTGGEFPIFNPYDGSLISAVADCGLADTKLAIEKAYTAYKSWRSITAEERSRILFKWYELQLENIDDLAQILTLEQGKPLKEARGEIKYGASFVKWFAEEARRIYGDTIPGHQSDKRIVVIKQPIGVVAAITPWNFPNAMITRKVAPALAAGCTVVIKPSELTPLSANALAVLADEAGFSPGVLNIINTSNPQAVGEELTSNPTVKKISFTGSTEVGKILLRQSADTVKKVSLELGGNAPFIVFDDADIEAAVKGAVAAKYRNAGQTCVCANRIFVQSGVYDEFITQFTKAVQDLKVGNGMEAGVEIGPLIEEKAVDFVEELIRDAKNKGAEVLLGGNQLKTQGKLFYAPTVLGEVSKEMLLFSKEIFGPIAPVFKFENEKEAIELANQTEYGLAAYFYGRDYARIWRVAEALEYGMVGINTGMISTTVAPFGGVKQSGFGREGSKYGIDEYLQLKYLCWGGV